MIKDKAHAVFEVTSSGREILCKSGSEKECQEFVEEKEQSSPGKEYKVVKPGTGKLKL